MKAIESVSHSFFFHHHRDYLKRKTHAVASNKLIDLKNSLSAFSLVPLSAAVSVAQ